MNIVSAEDDKRISRFLLQVLGEAGEQVRLANFSLRSIELYFSGSPTKKPHQNDEVYIVNSDE